MLESKHIKINTKVIKFIEWTALGVVYNSIYYFLRTCEYYW